MLAFGWFIVQVAFCAFDVAQVDVVVCLQAYVIGGIILIEGFILLVDFGVVVVGLVIAFGLIHMVDNTGLFGVEKDGFEDRCR